MTSVPRLTYAVAALFSMGAEVFEKDEAGRKESAWGGEGCMRGSFRREKLQVAIVY